MFKKMIATLALTLVYASAAQATIVDVNFRDYSVGTAFTTQIAGVSFSVMGGPGPSGAPVIDGWGNNGLSNSTTGNYPTASILDIRFDGLASNVSFNFENYGRGIGSFFTAFDSIGNVLETGSVDGSGFFSLAASGISDLQLNNNSTRSWLFDISTLRATVSTVPEPGSLALLGLGLTGLAYSRKRKAQPTAA
jgi:hypothetical protein